MTGLDKIIEQIEVQSEARCSQMLADARREAAEIQAQAQKTADAIRAEHDSALMKMLENKKQSAESSAQLQKSRIVLRGKLQAIDDTLEKAIEIIKALPRKEYFEILKELILKNALSGKGVLHLSAQDTAKLPQNFLDTVNSALKAVHSEIVLGDSVDIDSGFLLVYGDIDINCTFSAIAAAKREELRDALNELLFNEG